MEVVFKIQNISFEKKEQILVKLYGRTIDGKKVCIFDSFQDHFLIDISNVKNTDKIKEKFMSTETFDGEIQDFPAKFMKVYPKQNETKKLWEKYDCYEHDLTYEKKYLIEKRIDYSKLYSAEIEEKQGEINADIVGNLKKLKEVPDEPAIIHPKVLYFDLETYDDGKGINFEANPIMMISIYAKNKLKKVLTAKSYPTKNKNVEVFSSESEMLQEFERIIQDFKPDFISGYNIKMFDIPYVLKRCEMNQVNFNIGSDLSEVKETRNKASFFVEGIGIFDMYEFIKRIMRGSVNGSLSLDSVSEQLIGRNKEEVDLRKLSESWITAEKHVKDIDQMASYCLTDSVLVSELFDYFFYDITEFAKMLNVGFEELARLSFSQICENYLINNARAHNQVVPNRPDNDTVSERQKRRLKRAFVYEPTPGFYENLAVFDFRSLYPSIIESHNISKGRLVLKKEKGAKEVPEHKYYIKQKPKAFIPKVVESIIEHRGRLKELVKQTEDAKEKALLKSRIGTLKLIANSLYGYLGFYMARWYCFECAESVTAFGRHYIKETIDMFNKKGFEVIYSDTDSVFVLLGDKKLKDIHNFVGAVNDKLPGLMHLEFEKDYSSGVFVETRSERGGAKKKYALRDNKGNLKVAGMALVRGDWSWVAREMQKEVLENVLRDKNVEKAEKYVQKELKNLEKRKVEDFIIKTKLTKDVKDYSSKGPHVLVAEKMIASGTPVRAGTFVEYVITKGSSKRIGDRAKLAEEVEVENIDFDYYINNQIVPVLESIFEIFGKDINEINKNQQGLDSFF